MPIQYARFVGTAPSTTSFQVVRPTQSVWVPDPGTDTVKIAMPPNQWVTGPVSMRIQVPAHQNNLGPVPTDLQRVQSNENYLGLRKGWIATDQGGIFHLQGTRKPLGELTTSEKWGIAFGAAATLATVATSFVVVSRYLRDKKKSRRRK